MVGAVVIVRLLGAAEGWADQLAVGEAFLIVYWTGGWFGGYGFESIFQNRTTCALGGQKYATTLKPVIVGPEV